MKTNLFVLLGTLGCLCLATKAEAAESQAVRSEQTLRSSTPQSAVAQVLDSPSSNNLVLESPSSRVPNGDPRRSISQANEQLDQNRTVRVSRRTEAQQRIDNRLAQENENRARYIASSPEPSPQPPTPEPSIQPPAPKPQPVARRSVPYYRREAASRIITSARVTTPARQDATSESLVAQVPPEPSTEPEIVTKMLELENVTFQCGNNEGVPATIATIKDQDESPVILWSSNFFAEAGYDAQVRCEQVSARFEAYRKTDSSLYITFGKIQQQSVICITSQENGGCGEGISEYEGLLFTLKPNTDPQKTLEELAAIFQIDPKAEQKPLKE